MWFLRQDGEWWGKRWFSFLVQEIVPCGWCSRAGAVAGKVVLRLCLLAPLLAGTALFVAHDTSLVMKFDGEDSFEGILPEAVLLLVTPLSLSGSLACFETDLKVL